MTTDITRARAAREALLAEIGDDPRVGGVHIALTSADIYRLKVRLLDRAPDLAIPSAVGGVDVLVTAA